jgi:hypothetical protein
MNITLKNVPDSVYRVIKQEAKRKRRSLNSENIPALEKEAAEAQRRRQLSKLRKEITDMKSFERNSGAGSETGTEFRHGTRSMMSRYKIQTNIKMT